MLRQLPNTLTALRILLVVPIGWAIVTRRDDVALGLAVIAGVSDALDGFLARRFGWITRLGAWLDPIADKLMLIVAYLTLAWVGIAPWWLTLLVVARDIVIVIGAMAYRQVRGTLEIAPSRLSKQTTLLQILYVLLVLVELQNVPALPTWPLAWIVAAWTVGSGVDYVVRFARKGARQGTPT